MVILREETKPLNHQPTAGVSEHTRGGAGGSCSLSDLQFSLHAIWALPRRCGNTASGEILRITES